MGYLTVKKSMHCVISLYDDQYPISSSQSPAIQILEVASSSKFSSKLLLRAFVCNGKVEYAAFSWTAN